MSNVIFFQQFMREKRFLPVVDLYHGLNNIGITELADHDVRIALGKGSVLGFIVCGGVFCFLVCPELSHCYNFDLSRIVTLLHFFHDIILIINLHNVCFTK